MDTFSTSDLRRLTAAQQGPCVSLFMPTHAAGPAGQQDALRLKNLLAQAERSLVEQGVRAPEPRICWSRCAYCLPSTGFWEKRSLGLAVFISEGLWNCFRVPLLLEETVVVNQRFQLKPLLPLIMVMAEYFVLALSQNRVRFLAGRQFGMQEVKVDGLPKDMAQALNYDSSERPSMARAAPRGEPGGAPPCVTAWAAIASRPRRSWRSTSAASMRRCETRSGTSGPPRSSPASNTCCRYIVRFPVTAHSRTTKSPAIPIMLSEHELHERTWPLVQAHLEHARQDAVAQYRKLAGTGSNRRSPPDRAGGEAGPG